MPGSAKDQQSNVQFKQDNKCKRSCTVFSSYRYLVIRELKQRGRERQRERCKTMV